MLQKWHSFQLDCYYTSSVVNILDERRLTRDSPIGNRVRARREQLDIKQEALARMAGVKRSWLSVLELGGIKEPGARPIQRLAEALGVTDHYLLTGQDEPSAAIHAVVPESEAVDTQRLVERPGWLKRVLNDVADTMLQNVPLQPHESDDEQQQREHSGEVGDDE